MAAPKKSEVEYKGGRGKKRPDDDFLTICEKIATSNTALRTACDQIKMSTRTFFNWVELTPENQQHYTRAREQQADFLVDEMISIADKRDEDHTAFTGANVVQRDKLMIETRKFIAAKLRPKKYGDKVDLTTDGDKIQPVSLETLAAIASKINSSSV